MVSDVLVGNPHNHAVLGRVVLVLVLNHKTFAGIVVGLALAAAAELDLEPLEISFVFDNFNVDHIEEVGCTVYHGKCYKLLITFC